MKTTSVLATLATILLTVTTYAAGPKGGPTRTEEHLGSQNVSTEFNSAHTCSSCAAMSGSDEMATEFCQEGKQLTCSSCNTKTVVHRLDKARPQPKGKAARNTIVVNEHGENCLTVSKVVSRSDNS